MPTNINSNLPPGIVDGMLPGNRPEDIEFEEFVEWLSEWMDMEGASCEEVKQFLLSEWL